MTSHALAQAGAQDAAIACTLTSEQYRSRTAALADLAGAALTSRRSIEGGERLTFVDRPAVECELRAVVAAESSCCSFLRLDLRREEDGLVLDVTGPADAQPMIAELFA